MIQPAEVRIELERSPCGARDRYGTGVRRSRKLRNGLRFVPRRPWHERGAREEPRRRGCNSKPRCATTPLPGSDLLPDRNGKPPGQQEISLSLVKILQLTTEFIGADVGSIVLLDAAGTPKTAVDWGLPHAAVLDLKRRDGAGLLDLGAGERPATGVSSQRTAAGPRRRIRRRESAAAAAQRRRPRPRQHRHGAAGQRRRSHDRATRDGRAGRRPGVDRIGEHAAHAHQARPGSRAAPARSWPRRFNAACCRQHAPVVAGSSWRRPIFRRRRSAATTTTTCS